MTPDPVSYLAAADPILATVIKRVPRPTWRTRTDYFQALVKEIINQQLSDRAAATITRRFVALFPHTAFPKPHEVLALSDEKIRASGVSNAKISYIKNVAECVQQQKLDFAALPALSDEEVIARLVQIKGIGRWTAEMFLMLALGRQDVFSYADLGLRNALQKLYGFETHPTAEQAKEITDRWRPYRSWGSRYLWASL